MALIRFTAELIEEGQPPRVLGVTEVRRVGRKGPVADYDWSVGLPGRPRWRHGRLEKFRRVREGLTSNVWDLLFRVLLLAVYSRNREGKS